MVIERPPSDRAPLEPRASPRAAVSVEVSLESEHNFFAGLTENICEGGVFVATHSLRPIGTVVSVARRLPGVERLISAVCVVRWVRIYSEVSDAPPGMGLMFIVVSEDDMAIIRSFVDTRAPLFWE